MTAILALDILRFGIAFCGVIFGALELHDVIVDKRVLLSSGINGPRKIVAEANIKNEALRLVIQTIFLYLAVSAIMFPMATVDHLLRLLFNRSLLIVVTLSLTVKSYIDREVRVALWRYWMDEHKDRKRRKEDILRGEYADK